MMEKPAVLPIQLHPSNLRPLAYRILSKKHGLNIKSDALKVLADHIGPKFGIDWKGVRAQLYLEEIAKLWKEQERGIFIEGEGAQEILKEMEALESKSFRANSNAGVQKSMDSFLGAANRTSTVEDISEDDGVLKTTPPTSVTPPTIADSIDWKDYFRVINAFEQPIFDYNYLRKQYELKKNHDARFNSITVSDNVQFFQRRFHIVKDRLMRNEKFQASAFNAMSSIQDVSESNKITQIKNLLGRNDQRFLLFGMLTLINGDWYLQDNSDKIQLDITQTEPNVGSFYTSGSMVLCDGIYSSEIFYCSSIGHPPGERRAETLEANGNIDFFGIHANLRIDKDLNTKLKLLEREMEHKIIILGSDCFLDDLRTLDALDKLFLKLSEDEYSLPISIVFNGSFTSTPKHSTEYKQVFDSLAALLEKHPIISGNITLLFVPGVNDLWQSPIWPKRPIPKLFGNRLSKVVRNIQWCSNPTRMVYLSQEIVISRDDIGARFRRNTTTFPQEQEKVQEKLEQVNLTTLTSSEIDRIDSLPPKISEARKVVKTVLDQGHLAPFTKDLKPVAWNLDHVLTLSPIPTVLILADPTSPSFDVTYNGCRCLNPGRLVTKRKINYIEMELSTKKAEMKEVYF